MQSWNTKRRAYLHCAGITFADRMAAFCSFPAITGGKCGSNRGCVDFGSLQRWHQFTPNESPPVKGIFLWNGSDTGKGVRAHFGQSIFSFFQPKRKQEILLILIIFTYFKVQTKIEKKKMVRKIDHFFIFLILKSASEIQKIL